MRWNWKRYLTVPRILLAAAWAVTLGMILPLDGWAHPVAMLLLLTAHLSCGVMAALVPVCDWMTLRLGIGGRRGR